MDMFQIIWKLKWTWQWRKGGSATGSLCCNITRVNKHHCIQYSSATACLEENISGRKNNVMSKYNANVCVDECVRGEGGCVLLWVPFWQPSYVSTINRQAPLNSLSCTRFRSKVRRSRYSQTNKAWSFTYICRRGGQFWIISAQQAVPEKDTHTCTNLAHFEFDCNIPLNISLLFEHSFEKKKTLLPQTVSATTHH